MAWKPHIPRILAVASLLATMNAGWQPANPIFLSRAQKAFELAQKKQSSATNFTVAASELARASFALADLATSKGNLIVGEGATWEALAPGANGDVLTLDSTQTLGMTWSPPLPRLDTWG